jgi:pectinesterase
MKTSQPWTDMSNNSWKNARFKEYLNTGAGATTNSNRPQLAAAQAATYTPQKYLAGTDGWNPL